MDLYYVHPSALWKTTDGNHIGAYLASEVDARIAELEQKLAFANDAAAKGEAARLTAAGMEAHIDELQASHQATLSALKGELSQAQQAIQRVNEELRTADKHLTDTRRAHGILRNVLKMLDEGLAIHPTSPVHDEIRRLMVT